LLDILTGLRRIREHVPKRVVVSAVTTERKEFISCVCISLLACENAFSSRCRLPQFMPSARGALDDLIIAVQTSLREEYESYESNASGLGLALAFAFAEHEALVEMVESLESLLVLCRQLFGTSMWLESDQSRDFSRHTLEGS